MGESVHMRFGDHHGQRHLPLDSTFSGNAVSSRFARRRVAGECNECRQGCDDMTGVRWPKIRSLSATLRGHALIIEAILKL